MNNSYYNSDRQLFQHDSSGIDITDRYPEVSFIHTYNDNFTGQLSGRRITPCDVMFKYQIVEELLDQIAPILEDLDYDTFYRSAFNSSWTHQLAVDRTYDDKVEDLEDDIAELPRHGEGWLGMSEHASQLRLQYDNRYEDLEVVDYTPEKGLFIEKRSFPVKIPVTSNAQGSMSALDRIIFEDCSDRYNKVTRPSINVPQIPKHKMGEIILKRIQKSFPEADLQDAEILVESWNTIEATPDMINTFIKGFGKHSLDKTIEYFVNLAGELDAVSDMATIEETPAYQNYKSWLGTGYQAWFNRNHSIDPDDMDSDDIMEPEESRYDNSDVFRYAEISNEYPEDDWLKRQPGWYASLLRQVKSQDNYAKLKQLSSGLKEKSDQKRFTTEQGVVIWSAYKVRKRHLKAELKANPKVVELIDRVHGCSDAKVKYTGFWLVDQQQGGKNTGLWKHASKIPAAGWSLIKEAYFARRNEWLAKQEGLLS